MAANTFSYTVPCSDAADVKIDDTANTRGRFAVSAPCPARCNKCDTAVGSIPSTACNGYYVDSGLN